MNNMERKMVNWWKEQFANADGEAMDPLTG